MRITHNLVRLRTLSPLQGGEPKGGGGFGDLPGHFEIGAQEGTRTLTPYGTRPSNVCVYQFHHLSICKPGSGK